MGPCYIWAPYDGHCVETSLAPKSKYIGTPKPPNQTRLNKPSRSYHSNGLGHLKPCFTFLSWSERVFYVQKWSKKCIFFLSKTALSAKYFFPQNHWS